ncbi:hypothetical protein NDA12_005828 [Ustilago hordei]|nr:hypothetical protein NDA12_005828 [Ustilago hordei]KAJ1576271.1 hypothetical protein NDA15_007478 [Ustilago hordei]
MRSLGTLSITIALLGLIVFLTSTTKATTFPFEQFDDHPSQYAHYEDLERGQFKKASILKPFNEEQIKQIEQIYNDRPSYKGMPIIFSSPEGYRLKSLQEAFAAFPTVHLSGRHDIGQDSLTIRKHHLDASEIVKASPDVHEYTRDVMTALKTFGEPAAIVAYGHKLSDTKDQAGGSTKMPPDWEEVWKSSPAEDGITVQKARELLNENRLLKFKSVNNCAEIGIRLLPDGTVEQKWLKSLEPVFHV